MTRNFGCKATQAFVVNIIGNEYILTRQELAELITVLNGEYEASGIPHGMYARDHKNPGDK